MSDSPFPAPGRALTTPSWISRLFSPEPRKFIVGPDKISLHIPEELLIHSSSFFARQLRGPFKEGQSKEPIVLPDEDIDDIQIFYSWLLYGSMMFEGLMDEFERIARLWIFGDKIGAPAFQNEMMGILGRSFTRWFTGFGSMGSSLMPTILRLLNRAPPSSKLLHVVCEALAFDVVQHKIPLEAIRKNFKAGDLDAEVLDAYMKPLHMHAYHSNRNATLVFSSTEFMVSG
ncbi:MAG: hypothetical protein Q9165_001968 [Trypethelium subeluteriae]